MRIVKDGNQKVQVKIVNALRDTREKVDGKTNPDFGKWKYETVRTVECEDATGEEVLGVVTRALVAAEKK